VSNDTGQKPRGPSDATDYSSTKAPETQDAAEQREAPGPDKRLMPGGEHGVAADPGMSSLDRDQQPSGASGMGMEDFGTSTKDLER
jgi:hypothetical protein